MKWESSDCLQLEESNFVHLGGRGWRGVFFLLFGSSVDNQNLHVAKAVKHSTVRVTIGGIKLCPWTEGGVWGIPFAVWFISRKPKLACG